VQSWTASTERHGPHFTEPVDPVVDIQRRRQERTTYDGRKYKVRLAALKLANTELEEEPSRVVRTDNAVLNRGGGELRARDRIRKDDIPNLVLQNLAPGA
jgi:hypothetical protein